MWRHHKVTDGVTEIPKVVGTTGNEVVEMKEEE